MTVVVSDTSPIRALHHLNLLSLLPAQFNSICLPEAVVRELENPAASFASVSVRLIPFLQVRNPLDPGQVLQFQSVLDEGESAAIALALEIPDAALLIDETNGRRIAEHHGLKAFGTIRVLLDAKQFGHIQQVIPAGETT